MTGKYDEETLRLRNMEKTARDFTSGAILFLFLFLLLPPLVRAQAPTAREVGNRLLTSKGSELKQLLEQLDLPPEMADEYSSSAIIGFRWFYLNSRPGASLNVLALPCTSILGAPILLLERSENHWHLRDQEGMDCHYDDSASVQLASLTSSKQYDLLLRHDCKAHGTGYVEQHTRVLQIAGNRFKQVLDREDVIHAFPPGAAGTFEQSTFLPTSLRTLEQTREATAYDQNNQPIMSNVVITRRSFHWDGRRFVVSPWERLR
jgi:hypothetical protein